MMKHILFCSAVAATMILGLMGCKKNQTEVTDTTKLWPAYDVSAKKYGYIDQSGAFKIAPIFISASNFFSCGYANVQLDKNTVAFIDKKGNIKYSSTSASIDPFYYNYTCIYDNKNYGMMDKNFKYTIQPTYNRLGAMSYDGLVVARMTSDAKFGYVDAKGKSKISPMYEEANGFNNGYAAVSVDGDKYGLIDKKGKFVVQPTYDYIWALGNGRWGTYTSGSTSCNMIDAKGNIKGVFANIWGSYDDANLYCFADNSEKCGVADKEGKVVIAATYDDLNSFCAGFAAASTGSGDDAMFYIIDKKGNVTYSAKNVYARTPMHNGYMLVIDYSGETEVYKWIDKKGGVLYQWTYATSENAPARKAVKAEKQEWAPEPFFVLGK